MYDTGVTMLEGGLLGDYTVASPGSQYKYGQQVQGSLVVKDGTDTKPEGEGKPEGESAFLYHFGLAAGIVILLPSLLWAFIMVLIMVQIKVIIWYGFAASVGFFPLSLTAGYLAMMSVAMVTKLILKRHHRDDHPFHSLEHFR